MENVLAVASNPEMFPVKGESNRNNVRLTILGHRGDSCQTLRFQVFKFSFRKQR
jgi:hypothetical protein